jgi:hypothetical protein
LVVAWAWVVPGHFTWFLPHIPAGLGLIMLGLTNPNGGLLRTAWLGLPLMSALAVWQFHAKLLAGADLTERARLRASTLWPYVLAGLLSYFGVIAAGLPGATVDYLQWATAIGAFTYQEAPATSRVSYEWQSAGAGPGAQFTARAIADLDCDGVFATYERAGFTQAGLFQVRNTDTNVGE